MPVAGPQGKSEKKPFRILYLAQQFAPEMGAAAVRASEFARSWAAEGHKIRVLTGFPSYLTDGISAGYRNRLISREQKEGYEIIRTFTLTYKPDSIVKRFLSQIFYALSSIIVGIFSPKCDIVLSTSPPFTAFFTGYLISVFKRCNFVTEIRDLFPASAVAFGVLKEGPLVRILTAMENFFYRRSALVVGVTQGIINDIGKRGLKNIHLRLITNGVNTDIFRKTEARPHIRESYGLESCFVMIYTGILGRAQNLGLLMEAAERLRERKDIVLMLVGEGVERSRLLQLKEEKKLDNVIFVESQPVSRIPDLLSAADAGFASRRMVRITRGALPVKMFEYMSCELPVIFNGTGEAEEVLKAAEAGISVTTENPDDLAEAVIKLAEDPALRRRMGMKGRAHVERFFSRQHLAEAYAGLLKDLIH